MKCVCGQGSSLRSEVTADARCQFDLSRRSLTTSQMDLRLSSPSYHAPPSWRRSPHRQRKHCGSRACRTSNESRPVSRQKPRRDCESPWPCCSATSRTARSRNSVGYRFDVVPMTPSSQSKDPPGNPARFIEGNKRQLGDFDAARFRSDLWDSVCMLVPDSVSADKADT